MHNFVFEFGALLIAVCVPVVIVAIVDKFNNK